MTYRYRHTQRQTFKRSAHHLLSVLCAVTLNLWGCDQMMDDQETSVQGEARSAGAEAHTHDHRDSSTQDAAGEAYGDEEYAGTSARDSASGFSEDGDEALNEPSASAQTWQESEAAQRQPIVDVGGGNSLTLHSQRVSTIVEGHRARTIVDQIFYSPYDRELEGTFRYSLPVGASVSQYALYIGRITGELNAIGDRPRQDAVAQTDTRDLLGLSTEEVVERVGEDEESWGELRLGRIVSQADGREAYEDTTRRRVDPALVENSAPNAFQARVFPIQSRGYTRIIFAYEEDLARVDDELVYTFPLPEDEIDHLSFQIQVVSDETSPDPAEPILDSPLPLTPVPARAVPSPEESEEESEEDTEEGISDAWRGEVEGQGPGGAVTIRIPSPERAVELITGIDGDTRAFAGRLTLDGISELTTSITTSHERAIFVLDTSLSAQPTRFAINRALLQELLTQNQEIEEFAVLTFDLGAEWITEGFVPNDASQRAEVLAEVDRILLEGATRFDAVSEAIADAAWISGDVDLFLLSDGAINWGTQAPEQVALGLNRVDRVFAYRTGVGAENESLYRALTKRGGTFSCLTLESIPSCATAHTAPALRLAQVRVEGTGDQPAVTRELVYTHRGGDVFDGAELKIAGELINTGSADAVLSLTDGSQTHELRVSLTLSEPQGQLAPRAWAELLVSVMSESGQPQLQELIYALAQRYTILTREVVLLVLETDEEYTVYDLPTIWSETLSGVESIIDSLERAASTGVIYAPTLEAVLTQSAPQIQSATGRTLDELLEALDLDLAGLSLPPVAYQHQAIRGEGYTGDDLHDPSAYHRYMDEAEQRFADGLTNAAARALSTIVENDSSNGVALRLVAYRLHTWGLIGLSAELFTEILRRRPYEPQSYRDLAYVSREERPELAALLYEIAARGQWDERFQQMNILIGEEYSLFIRQLERDEHPLSARLAERRSELRLPDERGDLRVILSWNTDNVDIDLWVTSPEGEKCYYASPRNSQGGELLDDVVQGFGPERFAQQNAGAGEYTVQAHYYGNNGNRLEAETFVHVTVIKYAGTDREEVSEYDALLSDVDEVVTMARVSF